MAAHQAKEGHVASAFSILDALLVLYSKFVVSGWPADLSPDRDYVILSKGHGCLALYAVLNFFQQCSDDEMSTFCKYGSVYGGHPSRLKVPGVEASTGSLGHGLPISVGIAKALKIQKRHNKVFCIVGDGELNEGSNWEALLLAEQHRLDNLTILVDYNRSNDRAIDYGDCLRQKLESFGCYVLGAYGHDPEDIAETLDYRHPPYQTKCVILRTVKGKGIKEMENNPAWHHRAPTKEELDGFLKELA